MGRPNAHWFLVDLNCDGVVSADDFAEVTSHLTNRVAGVSMATAAGPVTAAKTQATKAAAKPAARAKVVKAKRALRRLQ